MTASEEDAHLFEAIKTGAQGFLFKNRAQVVAFAVRHGMVEPQE